jgi:hypothetical protein
MNQTLLFISLISSAQTFFVPPLDTGVVGNGARTFDLQLQNGTTSFSRELKQKPPVITETF